MTSKLKSGEFAKQAASAAVSGLNGGSGPLFSTSFVRSIGLNLDVPSATVAVVDSSPTHLPSEMCVDRTKVI